MSRRQEIHPSAFKANPFELFNSGWFILTAGNFAQGTFNGMTISWGSAGTIWGKPFAMVVVRPQRHTLPFLEQGDSFTLSAFGAEWKQALSFFGSKSGAKYDKFKETGLTPNPPGRSPLRPLRRRNSSWSAARPIRTGSSRSASRMRMPRKPGIPTRISTRCFSAKSSP